MYDLLYKCRPRTELFSRDSRNKQAIQLPRFFLIYTNKKSPKGSIKLCFAAEGTSLLILANATENDIFKQTTIDGFPRKILLYR